MPREKKHLPVSIQRPRPPRKQGHVTIEDVEAVVSGLEYLVGVQRCSAIHCPLAFGTWCSFGCGGHGSS